MLLGWAKNFNDHSLVDGSRVKLLFSCTMIPRDTKLIRFGGDFESWNFCIMGQDSPYK